MDPAQLSPAFIQHRLTQFSPDTYDVDGAHHASVALIVEPVGSGHSIFFIERARREGDPWSGQIAFPGGRREDQDQDAMDVAIRETHEEVGLVLSRDHCIGRLHDLKGRHGGTSAGMVISCFVFGLSQPLPVTANEEVHDVARVPITSLLDHSNRTSVIYHEREGMEFPGIQFSERDQRIVWGLTYRFLHQFFNHLGHSIPADNL